MDRFLTLFLLPTTKFPFVWKEKLRKPLKASWKLNFKNFWAPQPFNLKITTIHPPVNSPIKSIRKKSLKIISTKIRFGNLWLNKLCRIILYKIQFWCQKIYTERKPHFPFREIKYSCHHIMNYLVFFGWVFIKSLTKWTNFF